MSAAARPLAAAERSATHLATDADDAEIRALLRARPTAGTIAIALTREPHFRLAAVVEGRRSVTALVRDAHTGELLGLGTRSVREVFHRGAPGWIGYLGQLRAGDGRVGLRRLRDGFDLLRADREPHELPFDLTAIAEDNVAARRLLERGLPGIPRYRPVGDLVTLVIETGRSTHTAPGARSARVEDRARIVTFLQATLSRYAFAPRWTARCLERRSPGLAPENFAIVERDGRIAGCAACWDQRAFKQVVVTGYRPWLARLRPAANVVLRAAGRALLPPPGSTLALGYLSHLALADDTDEAACLALLGHQCAIARGRGLSHLVVAFRRGHALLDVIERRFPTRAYRSCIHAVIWDEALIPADLLGGRPLYLEAATL